MQKSTNKNIRWNTPFTHHIDSVCQLFGLVMRFSHFYTFDQYANFFVFHLKIMFVGFFFVWFCVDVAANFRNPALFCRSLFYFDVLIRRGWHSCTLYAIACMHTWRMNIEQVCGMIGLAQWYWMMRFTYTMVNYLSAMERFWCTGLITWFFFQCCFDVSIAHWAIKQWPQMRCRQFPPKTSNFLSFLLKLYDESNFFNVRLFLTCRN